MVEERIGCGDVDDVGEDGEEEEASGGEMEGQGV